MAETTARRLALMARRTAQLDADDDNLPVMIALHERISATELPAHFPSRVALVAAGYSAVEDLDGADSAEIRALGLTDRQTTAVLAALAGLL